MQVKLTLIAAAAAAVLFAAGVSAQDMVVKIGHVGPTSGGIAHLGKDNENGARMAIEELNAKGTTIGGKKVKFELLAEDDAADPKQGTAVAQKLVDSKVNGVIGHLNSGTSIPASKIYSDAGIPQISPSATNPKFTRNGYKTTFRVVADDVHLGGTLGRYAVKELKGKSIAVIDDRTAYGQGVAEEFEKAVKASGGSVAERQFTTDKATDFTAILTAVKSKNPDVVFFGGMDDFYKRFKAKYNVEVQVYAPYVYDAVNVMVAAMVKAGSAEPAKYLPVLAKTEGYQGVTGTIAFDAKGDIKNGALTLFTYKGDKREQIAVVR